ncbi:MULTISPECIES: heavy metal translocating P-type ATPase [Aliiglaciecola]|uniref:heavy metal translocating P-type ATPase n=1 Tax=Aliiglaciecola TaxID=1406885 RepID=UPI001C087232|nr:MULTISPECIES: heavy metal translocating P-type ATPase [Aliiglaciecola]MBU2876353.1 cadmium-translocating P-type ATPase [Aliiglaciecola lipolytica]MDO6710569.1 heavy metal translocating P-type ATPase [Aliiglaciecola sp. 2_MG-2023]MDO6751566.1 heavy metal translocating P-type ATPase [Aliiglaciecola sp. 1_MG-2023]
MQNSNSQNCYHCGLPIINGEVFWADILGEPRKMCCPGCQAVAEAIVSNGLEDYYRFRTEFADKGDELLTETLDTLKAYDHEEIQQEFVVDDGSQKQIQLTIEGISCAACGWLIEKQLLKTPGIKRIAVNVSARRATINWIDSELKLSEIIGQLESIGYHALPFQADEHEASYQKESKNYLKRIGLAGLMSMQVMMLAIGLYFGIFGSIDDATKEFLHWVSFLLTTPVVLYSGFTFYKSAFSSLRMGSVNMDFSVSIAIIGTFVASAWATISHTGEIYFESVCMFIFLLLISRFLEHRSRHQASLISANMFKYIPLTAMQIDDDNKQTSVLAKHLKKGQKIVVRPGETFPVDGVIINGNGNVDESMLTGESEKIRKSTGAHVYGGTINLSGSFEIEVENELKLSLVNKILRLQELALSDKPKAAVYADIASKYFIVIVLGITLISYVGWLAYQPERAFWVAISILVATCPCALSLATPTALTSAIAKLNQYGLLVKRANIIDVMPDVDTVIFDKTGTLTNGHFSVSDVELFNAADETFVYNLAAGLELYSKHPISHAFQSQTPCAVSQVVTVAGKGLQGTYQSQVVKIGNISILDNSDGLRPTEDDSRVYLQLGKQLIAAFSVKDVVKKDAKQLVDDLRSKQLVMLSGDSEINASLVADSLGIPNVYFRQTPIQKLTYIQNLQAKGHKVLMIGDGINDAPVLAAADVSIAVGDASDMAKRSADIILLNSKLSNVKFAVSMAIKVRTKIKQNMVWAIGYNALILPLAVAGYLSPWMAVIGMSLSSIIVVANSIRLLR